MFVSYWFSTIKLQNNSEITNFLGNFLIPNWRSMLDNPGWILSADISNYGDFLKETKPLGRDNDVDWIDFEVRVIAKTYVYIEIFGDISKLNKILYSFKAIIEELEEIEKQGKGILSAHRIKEIIDDALS